MRSGRIALLAAVLVAGLVACSADREDAANASSGTTTTMCDPDLWVYFTPGTAAELIDTSRGQIEALPGVLDSDFFDAERTYEEFRRLFADEPEMIDGVKQDELPQSLRMAVDESKIPDLTAAIEPLPGVEQVESSKETRSQPRDPCP